MKLEKSIALVRRDENFLCMMTIIIQILFFFNSDEAVIQISLVAYYDYVYKVLKYESTQKHTY